MNDTSINDFSASDLKLIADTLVERYGKTIDTQRADIELNIDENVNEPTSCPAVYWEHEDCHFILAKATDNTFFAQYFYSDSEEQYGTGKSSYDGLHSCIIALLQAQANHELSKAGVLKENS